ncbi:CRISPR-associated protein, Csx3 family [Ferroglobus placidus DSM 10642]|uniref:CRISPR-associated protein, Csx3 family n=1 Tax=Ferroglobus placidus (strain DSM 10642 / AEDII12DO) TaxID=589924 RepID=D3S350_FERPA|nr:CRISPR-associated ring nuclease Crn3/Csx3 [Ferroglobus placidus]ADC64683.1 CRISPR-associated protein, Csx3 family [Ferroglobus placidus DSM 10642]
MFRVKESESRTGRKIKVLEFELEGPISPQDLPEIEKMLPEIRGAHVLVISGRGPIWLYCVILHKYMHMFPAIGVYDPKLEGAVIVVSHTRYADVGTVIPIDS